MYYGAALDPATTINAFETTIGGTLGVFRRFFAATQVSNMVAFCQASIASGRLPIVSTKAPIIDSNAPNQELDWQSVASGAQDAWLTSIRSGLASVPGPVWFCIHHEPRGDGTQATYRAMYDRVVPFLAPATNVVVTPILNGYAFVINENPRGWVSSAVKVVGVDHYNNWWTYGNPGVNLAGKSESYHTWKPPSMFSEVLDITDTWGIPVFFAEYGVHYAWNEPGKSAQWLLDAYEYCRSRGVIAMAYFNSGQNSDTGGWRLDKYTIIPPLDNTQYDNTERLNAFITNCQKSTTAYL